MIKLMLRTKDLIKVALVIMMLTSLFANRMPYYECDDYTENQDSFIEETTEADEEIIITGEEYDELIAELFSELDKKDFPYEGNMLFKEALDKMYVNFDSWEKGYRDFPERKEFIRSNLIDPIKNISEIQFTQNGTPEAEELLNEVSSYAWVTKDEEGNSIIGVIAEKYGSDAISIREHDLECFLYTLEYCKTTDADDYNEDTFKGYEIFEEILNDGMATFNQKFIYNADTKNLHGSWLVTDEAKQYEIAYKYVSCISYLLHLNACEKLIYLTDYNTVEDVKLHRESFSVIRDKIAEKYGEKKADSFLTAMNDWYVAYNDNWISDTTFDLSVKLERLFVDMVKQDVESLETKQEAEAYKVVYDFYMEKNLPEYSVYESYENTSREVFGVVEVDEMLKEKLA